MAVLIGCTGFVGSHLARGYEFDHSVHRTDIATIAGVESDLLVCAGLPAEKWRANLEPAGDWQNMTRLAQVLASVRADRAILISTIDVYQPAVEVAEVTPPQFVGPQAYGAHRAWFEVFFRARFSSALILRLPALFAPDVRKNLVHDLLHGKEDQWANVSPQSTFQFFDVTHIWRVIKRAWELNLKLLNITSAPVTAQDVADQFGVRLSAQSEPTAYDMRSVHAPSFGGQDGYLFSRESILGGIAALRHRAG